MMGCHRYVSIYIYSLLSAPKDAELRENSRGTLRPSVFFLWVLAEASFLCRTMSDKEFCPRPKPSCLSDSLCYCCSLNSSSPCTSKPIPKKGRTEGSISKHLFCIQICGGAARPVHPGCMERSLVHLPFSNQFTIPVSIYWSTDASKVLSVEQVWQGYGKRKEKA